jgi:hypothetical protein
MTEWTYQKSLYNGKGMTFEGGGPTMAISYYDGKENGILFTVDGNGVFPAIAVPISYWRLRLHYKKYSPECYENLLDYHPLELIYMDIDESEAYTFPEWLEAIGDLGPHSGARFWPRSKTPVDPAVREAALARRVAIKAERADAKQAEMEERRILREARKAAAAVRKASRIPWPSQRERSLLGIHVIDGPINLKLSFKTNWRWDDDVEGDDVVLKKNCLFDWKGHTDLRLFQLINRAAKEQGQAFDNSWSSALYALWMTEGEDKGRALWQIEVGAH